MPNENIQLKKGLSRNLPSTYTPGQILFETDTGNMYVDVTSTENPSQRVQVKDDTKLPLTGGTLSGPLRLTSSNMRLYGSGTNLILSNTNSSGRLVLRGSKITIQGPDSVTNWVNVVESAVDVFNKKILNVATPTEPADAANKAYVDTGLADKQDKWATVSGESSINSLTNSKDNLQISADGYISLYSPLVRIGAGDPQILTISSSSATVSGNLKMNRGKQIQFTDEAGTYSTFMSTSGTDTSTIWTFSTPGTIRFKPSGLSISISTNGIDMGSSGTRKITNLIAPTAATDAANKQYVDGLYQNLESEIVTTAAQYLPLKGGTMTGDLTLKSSYLNFEGSDGVSSAYISYDSSDGVTICASSNGASLRIVSRDADNDNRFAQFYNGTTATSLRVTGISTPVYSNDAANKQYVDTTVANKTVSWSSVTSKPFTSIGTGLQVSGNVLSVDTSELIIDDGSLS